MSDKEKILGALRDKPRLRDYETRQYPASRILPIASIKNAR